MLLLFFGDPNGLWRLERLWYALEVRYSGLFNTSLAGQSFEQILA